MNIRTETPSPSGASTAPQSRHALLRSETRLEHAALEEKVEQAGYFSSIQAYSEYLRRLALFHTSFLGAASSGGLSEWGIEEHAAHLETDLRELCVDPYSPRAAARFRKPEFAGSGRRLGALYVLLGSALGARILVRQATALGLTEGEGIGYLTALAGSNFWPDFLKVLESTPIDDRQELVAGAKQAFESIMDHLTEPVAA